MAKKTRSGGQLRGIAAVMASQIGIVGNDWRISMTRWMIISGAPPK